MQCRSRLHVHDASRLPAAGQQNTSRGDKPLTPWTEMTGLAVAVAVAALCLRFCDSKGTPSGEAGHFGGPGSL